MSTGKCLRWEHGEEVMCAWITRVLLVGMVLAVFGCGLGEDEETKAVHTVFFQNLTQCDQTFFIDGDPSRVLSPGSTQSLVLIEGTYTFSSSGSCGSCPSTTRFLDSNFNYIYSFGP